MSMLEKIFKKYNLKLLIDIILHEIYFILANKELPLLKLKKKKNKNYHLSIATPYFYLKKIQQICDPDFFLFVDFGCGDGRVLKFLSKKFKRKKFLGFELDHILVNKNKDINKNVEIKNENLSYFNKKHQMYKNFNNTNKKKIYLFFYNPFNVKIVKKIINNFAVNKNIRIILLGFKINEYKYIVNNCSIKQYSSFYDNTLRVLKNAR